MSSRSSRSAASPRSRADDTRQQILTAAADALADGDSAFAIGSIAERAGLTRQAVYLHFHDRGDLLVSAVDELNRRLGLDEDRRRIADAADAGAALDTLVEVLVVHAARTLPALRAVRRLLEEDPAAKAAWAARKHGRAADIARVVTQLGRARALRDGLTPRDASALVQAVVSIDAVAELVAGRGWSAARAAAALSRAVRAAILRHPDL